METQAGRSVGYRQVLEYLHNIWGYPCGGDDGDIPYSLKVFNSIIEPDTLGTSHFVHYREVVLFLMYSGTSE